MHDCNGNLIQKGDTVTVAFTVKSVHAAPEYCNCDLESVIPMPGNGNPTFLSAINTKQTEKLDTNLKFSFDEARDIALKVIGHLEQHGDEYLALAVQTISLAGFVYKKQFLQALIAINAGVSKAQELIDAIKKDFGLS